MASDTDPASAAAEATAAAAKDALASMTLAQESAEKTAKAARLVVLSTNADLADATSDAAMAGVNEAAAQVEYRAATDRATRNG